MNEMLIRDRPEEDIDINLAETTEIPEYPKHHYLRILVNFVRAFLRIKLRNLAYKFSYLSCLMVSFSVATLFLQLKTNPEKNPPATFISSTLLSSKLIPKNLYFGPDNLYTHKLLSILYNSSSPPHQFYFNTFQEMTVNISTDAENDYYGIFLPENLSSQIIISKSLITSQYSALETILLSHLSNMSFLFNSKSYAKPPETINFEQAMSGFYLIFPYFCLMLISLGAAVNYSTKRQTFYLILNGLPELLFYLGNAICYFLEMMPICLFFFFILSTLISGNDVNINLLYFAFVLIWFLVSYSLRFVTYSTFIHTEKIMSLCITIIQFINLIEVTTLDYLPNLHKSLQIFLLLMVPQYPILCVYYVYAKMDTKEIKWNSKSLPNFFSYKQLLLIQVFNAFINVIITYFFIIMNKPTFGLPLIGWKNIFKKKYWMRLFRFRPISLNFRLRHLIKIDHLKYAYKTGEKTQALSDVNMNITSDEVIVLVGPNGSGKSTLIDILTEAIEQDEGSITFSGHELRDIYYEYHRQLGVVFQADTLFDELTCREHFKLFSFKLRNRRQVKEQIERLSSLLKISNILDSRTKDISGGEKRKLCLALALMQNPKFLILDEPTSGVDAYCRRTIWKVIGDLEETTVVVSTHSLEESEYVSTRFAVMSKGEVIFLGTAAEMRLQFNSGYKITFVNSDVDLDGLLAVIQNIIPEATILEDKKNTINLPSDLRVANVLQCIESNKMAFNVQKYHVQIDNLEESLVKLIEEEENGRLHFDV